MSTHTFFSTILNAIRKTTSPPDAGARHQKDLRVLYDLGRDLPPPEGPLDAAALGHIAQALYGVASPRDLRPEDLSDFMGTLRAAGRGNTRARRVLAGALKGHTLSNTAS